MSNFLEIKASSVPEALNQAKKAFGENILIVEIKEEKGQCTLVLSEKEPLPSSFFELIQRKNSSFPHFSTISDNVNFIQCLADDYNLPKKFYDLWIKLCVDKKLSVDLALSQIICCEEPSATLPLIFLGPPKSGKTSILGKMAVQHTRPIVTLDTRFHAISQLEQLAKEINVPFGIGVDSIKSFESCLIDTQGVDLNSERDQDFLFHLTQNITGTFILVLSGDSSCEYAKKLAKYFYFFQTTHLFVTHCERPDSIGIILQAAFEGKMKFCGVTQNKDTLTPVLPWKAKDILSFAHTALKTEKIIQKVS